MNDTSPMEITGSFAMSTASIIGHVFHPTCVIIATMPVTDSYMQV